MKPEQKLEYLDLHVGQDGAWIELKTKSGKSFAFQPAQQFGENSHWRGHVTAWANEVQSFAPDPEPVKRFSELDKLSLEMAARGECTGTLAEWAPLETAFRNAGAAVERSTKTDAMQAIARLLLVIHFPNDPGVASAPQDSAS